MTESTKANVTQSARPQPPLAEGWNPKLLSLRLSRKHRKLYKVALWWEMYRAEKSTGPGDLSDLLAPGQERAADFPGYYVANPVHGMTGMHWMDPSMGQRLEVMSEDFAMGRHEQIEWWINSFVVDAGIKPKRIIDIGCGSGATTFVYAEIFPDAEVIGIDISPSVLRWAKKRAAEKGLKNAHFYHMDAADLGYFADDSFDVVHEAHTLHEMPDYQIRPVVAEMVRLCRPGGLLGFFDWALPENEQDWKHRQLMVRVKQEPFMMDYATTDFPSLLAEWGCTDIERLGRHSQSAHWKATKGPDSNALLASKAHLIESGATS